jgi:cyclopropane-fatty-acyl-phospholipid synthase
MPAREGRTGRVGAGPPSARHWPSLKILRWPCTFTYVHKRTEAAAGRGENPAASRRRSVDAVKWLLRHFGGRELPVRIKLWNGASLALGSPESVLVEILDPRALPLLWRPTLGGLASGYVERRINFSGNLRDILRVGQQLCDVGADNYRRASDLIARLGRRHTRTRDRDDIHFHYDVGNDFYGLWLDSRRVYSCAYFKEAGDTLDQAQANKLDLICRKLKLRPGDRLLDIGCGWGGLILWAAEHYGVDATGITLSEEQHAYASRLIEARGLSSRCRVSITDYRDIDETKPYDRIASVGMFEHVGIRQLPGYFSKMQRLLRPGGLALNHGITHTAPGGTELGSDIGDFVERYVFPGGELAHAGRVLEAAGGQGLEILDCENLRPHYARTLWHWVDRLEASREAATALVGEKKFRIWEIYMAGSAHAFETGWLSLFQILVARPDALGRNDYPYKRDYIYC